MKTKPSQSSADVLDMEPAIAALKTTRPTFYRWLRSGQIKGMKVGRQWRFYQQDIDRFLQGEPPRIDLPASIEPLISQLRQQVQAIDSKSVAAGNDVASAVSLLIQCGVRSGASDIHLAGCVTAAAPTGVGQARLRIDGRLKLVAEFDLRLLPALMEPACDPREREKPQDGRIMTQVDGPAVDLRVCFIPSVLGESVTLRILARNQVILGLEELQYAPHDFARIQRALSHPWGLIVCAGPTGCGKTTLLYSCLNRVTGPATKVMSIEDPVEFVLPQVVQIPLNSRAGLTFSVAMRSILRSDPDVIMVGDIRDVETLNISFQAALTSHLVLTTLHTPDAASTLIRMVNIGSPEFLVTDATRLIIAQRLVRRVCPECSVAQKPTGEQLERARARATAGGLVWEKMPAKFRSARGCAKCVQLGYRGRTVVAEVLEVTPEIAASLRRGAGAEELTAIAVRQGMTSMGADAIRRAGNGDTTLEEALRVTGSR